MEQEIIDVRVSAKHFKDVDGMNPNAPLQKAIMEQVGVPDVRIVNNKAGFDDGSEYNIDNWLNANVERDDLLRLYKMFLRSAKSKHKVPVFNVHLTRIRELNALNG